MTGLCDSMLGSIFDGMFNCVLVFVLFLMLCLLFVLKQRDVATYTGAWKKKPVSKTMGKPMSKTMGKSSADVVKDLRKHPRSKSEAAVIRYLEEVTGKRFPTVNPSWLVLSHEGTKTLELDGYNKELGVAVEFSGPLHTKWSPSIESYPAYFERIRRDIIKRETCKKHGVHFFTIDISLPREHWRNYILSRLYDFGVMSSRPAGYIEEQWAEPYRNEHLEREYNLKLD